jgi:signal transduction histidine kinase
VRRLPYVALGWLVFGAVQWLLSRISMRSIGSPSNVLFRTSMSVLWIALTFVIWAWVDRLDRSRLSRAATLAAHVVGIVVVDLIDTAVRRAIQLEMGWKTDQLFIGTAMYFLDLTTIAYVAVVVLKRVADAQDAIVRQEHRQLTLRTQLAHAQLGYLETQLQPHFLFNSLGAVLELAHEAPKTAARMLRHLSALLRFAVHGRAQTVTLAEELDALEPYLEIQRLRFADWLTISRDATPEALRASVPRMTLQPLVENAIRHGLAGRTQRGHIAICASLEGRVLVLEVSDNGVGLGATARDADAAGIGLGNLTKRLRTLYGGGASVVLKTGANGGATTEVRLDADLSPPRVRDVSDAAESSEPDVSFLSSLLRRNMWTTIAVGWLLWGMIWVELNMVWMSVALPKPPKWSMRIVTMYGLAILLWAVLTPLMLAVARRNSLTRGGLWWRLALHVVFACVFALAHVAAWQLLEGSKEPLWSSTYIETTLWTAMLYVMLVGLTSYQEISEWLRERETATARLRAEIAEAELTAAAMRFDPEVVLERLERIAAIVVIDAEAAEHSLTQLADHLRVSLDSARGVPRTLVAWPTPAR